PPPRISPPPPPLRRTALLARQRAVATSVGSLKCLCFVLFPRTTSPENPPYSLGCAPPHDRGRTESSRAWRCQRRYEAPREEWRPERFTCEKGKRSDGDTAPCADR